MEYFENRLRRRVQEHLESGEVVEQAFVVGLGSRGGAVGEGAYSKFAIVAATDRNLVVLSRNALMRPTGVVRRLPRDTRIGPVSGALECTIRTLGEPMSVLRKNYSVVRSIDTAAGFPPD